MPNDKEKQTITPDSVGDVASILGPPVAFEAPEPGDTEIKAVKPPTVAQDAEDAEDEAFKLALRTKEAGDVLSWLNENACLVFGALPKALAAIEAGAHRR